MYPAAFAFHAPDRLDEAVALLAASGGEAKVMAGGCSLIPLIKLRLSEPAALVDLGRIPGLDGVRWAEGAVTLGALVRQATIVASSVLADRLPALHDAARVIADPLVRNRATVGGNVAHADPANDVPAVAVALGASVGITGPRGERLVPADAFVLDPYVTALASDEILTSITFPLPPDRSGSAYVKLERQVGDLAILGAAAAVRLEPDGSIAGLRVALTNAGPRPVRATTLEAALVGTSAVDDAAGHDRLVAACEAVLADAEPWDELRGSVSYKRRVLPTITARAIERALRRARAARATAAA